MAKHMFDNQFATVGQQLTFSELPANITVCVTQSYKPVLKDHREPQTAVSLELKHIGWSSITQVTARWLANVN